jgi:hypothetical protein
MTEALLKNKKASSSVTAMPLITKLKPFVKK